MIKIQSYKTMTSYLIPKLVITKKITYQTKLTVHFRSVR